MFPNSVLLIQPFTSQLRYILSLSSFLLSSGGRRSSSPRAFDQSINQSTNQSINQSINQPLNQSIISSLWFTPRQLLAFGVAWAHHWQGALCGFSHFSFSPILPTPRQLLALGVAWAHHWQGALCGSSHISFSPPKPCFYFVFVYACTALPISHSLPKSSSLCASGHLD